MVYKVEALVSIPSFLKKPVKSLLNHLAAPSNWKQLIVIPI